MRRCIVWGDDFDLEWLGGHIGFERGEQPKGSQDFKQSAQRRYLRFRRRHDADAERPALV